MSIGRAAPFLVDRGRARSNSSAKWIGFQSRCTFGQANRQHYELPADFFALTLGPARKYSCCLYPTGEETLAEAETLALEATVERADLKDGQQILELGCGWGSLSLFMAERFPSARITAVSNSASQRRYIEHAAAERRS